MAGAPCPKLVLPTSAEEWRPRGAAMWDERWERTRNVAEVDVAGEGVGHGTSHLRSASRGSTASLPGVGNSSTLQQDDNKIALDRKIRHQLQTSKQCLTTQGCYMYIFRDFAQVCDCLRHPR